MLDERKGVWKSGKGRGRDRPKGRQLDDAALGEVRRLLGDRPRRRDLLIEFLHLIQDAHGHLSAAHLRALAEEMRLAQAEVYEVATFYAHFDVVKEGEAPPPALTVRVCDSLSCELAGAQALIAALRAGTDPARVRVVRAPCMGRCDVAPTAEVGHFHVDAATPEAVAAAVAAGRVHAEIPDYEDLAAYRAAGGYAELAALRGGSRTPDEVAEALLAAGLRGQGGAGFPTGRKWRLVRAEPGAALPRGQRRRGRARDVQGPLLSRAHPAPDARGHADRRLGGRGRALLRLHARRVSGDPRDPAPGDRGARGGGAGRARLRRAPPRRRRLHLRRGVGDARVDRGQARAAAAPAALRRPGRPLRAADAGAERRDPALGGADLPRGAGGAERARAERPQGPAQLLGVGAGGAARGLPPAGGLDDPRRDRGGGRHGRGARLQGLPAGRAVVGAAAGVARRRAARLRHAAAARHLHRLGGGRRAVGPGQRPGGGAQHAPLLRGRELRPVHPLPGRLRQGGAADGGRALGPGAAGRARPHHGGREHLRARPGGAEPDPAGDEALPGQI